MPRLIDLSHTVEDGMVTYKGLPAPIICDFMSREASRLLYAAGVEFEIEKIEMVGNTGTYLDAPFHRYADGMDLSELDLRAVAALDTTVIRVPDGYGRSVGADLFADRELAGRAVLIQTGWDQHWRTDQYFEESPFLSREAAELLVEAGPALVGIDSFNMDDLGDLTRPAHTLLLGAGVLIVEHMTGLKNVPDAGGRFFAVPVKIKRMGTFPVRAFIEVEG